MGKARQKKREMANLSSDLQKKHLISVDELKSTITVKESKIRDLESAIKCANEQARESKQFKSLCKSKSDTIKSLENQKKDLLGSLDLIKKQLSSYKMLGEKTAVSFKTCKDSWVSP